jgi:outer membrane protein assembly factor BamB
MVGLVFALLSLSVPVGLGDDWPQWRGPDRTGISKETGLLKDWPADGPKQLWAIDTPAQGYAAASVVGETIYLTGTQGSKGVLYALDLSGKVKWQQAYGPEWTKDKPLARTTPTVEEGSLYVYGGMGTAACFDAKTGKPKWSVDTFRELGGRNIQWGIAESPLIVGDRYICHPGGKDAAVVALDKKTGKTLWTSKGLSDKSAYCSPIAVQLGPRLVILTQTENNVVGLDAETGKVLWTISQRNRWAVHPNTPILFDGMVFISSGYRYGSQLIKLSGDGAAASQVWQEKKLDSHHEGVLLIDGRIYGSSSAGRFYCLDPKDGSVVYQVNEVKKAAIVYADKRIYAYDEKGGNVWLVEVSPSGYKMHGQFKITKGSGPHWAHPVVANGVLYIRHGEAFLAFDVKAK